MNQQLMADLTFKNRELENFNKVLKETIDKLTQVGTAISSEKNCEKLLERIVTEALNITNADCLKWTKDMPRRLKELILIF